MSLFYVLAVLVFLFDQITKFFVDQVLVLHQSIPLIQNILHFTLVHNQGAAFGILQNYGFFLPIVTVVVMIFVFYFHRRVSAQKPFLQAALAFIFGGSLGNLVDRIRFGYVVDFIDFRFWPVFNLADVFINIGVLILVVYLLEHPQS